MRRTAQSALSLLGRAQTGSGRFYSTVKPITCTLFPGDGIGPEIADAVREVFSAAGAPIVWDEQHVGTTPDPRTNSMVTRENLDSVLVGFSECFASVRVNLLLVVYLFILNLGKFWMQEHKVGLKGPMTTPIGKGFRSLNLTLRKELQLYANVRPCFSIPGYKTKYENVDLVTIRENTEGEYSGLEHQVIPGVVESLKVFPPYLLCILYWHLAMTWRDLNGLVTPSKELKEYGPAFPAEIFHLFINILPVSSWIHPSRSH